jgi:hypothetical protein
VASIPAATTIAATVKGKFSLADLFGRLAAIESHEIAEICVIRVDPR